MMKSNKTLSKTAPLSSASLKTYCLGCRKHTGNTRPEDAVVKHKFKKNKKVTVHCVF